MISWAIARAFANIALVKYWGKREGAENLPATASISLAIDALKTVCKIERLDSGQDEIFINGAMAVGATSVRIFKYLDFWRAAKLIDGHFLVTSENNFPTGAGLASSASGFAALAVALAAFSERKIAVKELSRLARVGSGSSARSITGGLSALPIGKNPSAKLMLDAESVPFGMVVMTVESAPKKIPSGQGMEMSRNSSPYYNTWLKQAQADYEAMTQAIRTMDFAKIGEIAESNALVMHTCMIAGRPPLLYWSGKTIEIIKAVWKWRSEGLQVYFTVDAGPNVILIARREDLNEVSRVAESMPGIQRIILGLPAGGSEILMRE